MTHDKQKAKGSLRSDQDRLIFGEGFSFSGYERDPLYLNLGRSKFLDVSGCSGIDSVTDGRASVFADLDNDGDLDVFVTTIQSQPHLLFRNNVGQDRNWLRVSLEGRDLGRDVFSAVVRVRTGTGVLTKIKAGGSGYISQHDPRLLFGLGEERRAGEIEVTWPDGLRETFPGPFDAGSNLLLVEGRGRAETLSFSGTKLPDPMTPAQAIAAELRLRVGERVPDLPVVGLDGARTWLSDLLKPGRRVLVNVWATWCTPCQKEMPELESLRASLAARGVDVLGLNVDSAEDAPVAAIARERVRYPVYRLDPAAIGQLYATDALTVPVSFVIGTDGRVSELIPGWSDATRRRFAQLAAGEGSAAR